MINSIKNQRLEKIYFYETFEIFKDMTFGWYFWRDLSISSKYHGEFNSFADVLIHRDIFLLAKGHTTDSQDNVNLLDNVIYVNFITKTRVK